MSAAIQPARRGRGFTLIEMLITISLMGIVIALVAPSMRDLIATQRVRSINSELVTDLQFARTEAVRRGFNVFVEFRSVPGRTCYTIKVGGAVCNCLRGPGLACNFAEDEIRTVVLPRQLNVSLAASSSAANVLLFSNENGRANPPDFRVDVVSTQRGALRTVTNAAGRPAVCSPDGSITQVPRCED